MATKIPVPKLGQSEETVTIASWRVKEGDKIKKGDVLFEVETDKAVLEVESQFEGVAEALDLEAAERDLALQAAQREGAVAEPLAGVGFGAVG